MNDTLHIVCPHCAAVNRLPQARSDQAANCGKCHRPLFTGHPVELDVAGFQQQLARSDLPLLVDFWAPWCGPCRMMAPAYEQAAGELEPLVRVAKLNTEQAQAVAAQHGIRSIPTLALFQRGREIARQAGAMGTADIVHWTRSHL